ncbi:MAG: methionyl-tRNA formyltransferase [bacterium]|nr:methionyl-tRNA formyltransferase [bacterium]
MNNMKYRVIFFGSSQFSLYALNDLYANDQYELVAVVSQPDKPVGRKQTITPTPVSLWAQEHKIELIAATSWKKIDPAIGENINVARLKELKPDFGVLVYYGRILPQTVIDAFPKGIVNTHPSLLPKYRGPAPGQMAILKGETESGVSIMLLEAGQDTGPVLAQEKFEVAVNEIPDTYYEKGFKLGTVLMMKVLPDYLKGTHLPVQQVNGDATNTPLLSRDNGKIDWSQGIEQIERMVRAFTPWPGTWTEVWEDYEGQIHFPDEIRGKLGLNLHGRENWDGVARKRMKILTAFIQDKALVLDEVQIEGEQKTSFELLKIV